MFEFTEHDIARQTAEACLVALFDPAVAGGVPAAEHVQAEQPTPVSKRDFLRGRWRPAAALAPDQ